MKAQSISDLALSYIERNPDHFIFPIKAGAKMPPMIQNNLADASNDPAQINCWRKKYRNCNWGLALAKSGLIAVDVDMKPGKVGKTTFTALAAKHKWPKTFTAMTPSGGVHLYYRGKHVFALGKNGFGTDVDSPNYVLIPGCKLADGTTYAVKVNGKIAAAPKWFAKYLTPKPKTESVNAEPAVDFDQPANVAWAVDYLLRDAPFAIEGQGGELTTLKVAMTLRDHGISRQTAKDLMAEHYNQFPTCDPLWETADLEKKIDNAFDYASIREPGAATAESDFADDPPPPETDEQRILREQHKRETEKKKLKESGLPRGVAAADFYSFPPEAKYIFLPTGALWPKESVNSAVGKGTTRKLDRGRAVQIMTWCPGHPKIIEDRLVDQDWIERPGCATFNLYRPPVIKDGNASGAGPWRAHLRLLYPKDADHIEKWFAHRVQRPGDKINHALVLGGPTRIGKDTLIEPVKAAIGPWNFHEVTASQAMDAKNNGYLEAVILRISEARDFGEKNRYGFYEHWKPWLTSPPNVVTVADKWVKAHPVFNCVGVIITSNYKAGGLYLPPDDARHYVAWSDMTREKLAADYFPKLWHWYESGGLYDVAAFLRELDLSGFDAKAPPPQTEAFWQMVQSHQNATDQDLADVIAKMPPLADDPLALVEAFTVKQLIRCAMAGKFYEVAESLQGVKNMTTISRRLLECGYDMVRSRRKDGRWYVNGRNAVIYARSDLPQSTRIEAAELLAKAPNQK